MMESVFSSLEAEVLSRYLSLASMKSDSVISLRVVLRRFSRIRGRPRCGEAMEMKKSIQVEVAHSSQ